METLPHPSSWHGSGRRRTPTLVEVEFLGWRSFSQPFDIHQVTVGIRVVQSTECHIWGGGRKLGFRFSDCPSQLPKASRSPSLCHWEPQQGKEERLVL